MVASGCILEERDISYAIVVSTIWKKRIKASRRSKCNFEGACPVASYISMEYVVIGMDMFNLPCPTKSRTTARPSAAPCVVCVHILPMLKNNKTRYQNRNDRFGSTSLGLEH